MEIHEHEMTGQVFRECLTVLGWTRMSGTRRYLAVRCSVCSEDPELFGDGIFETTKDSLVRLGYLPCGCGWAFRYTQNQYEVMLRRKAAELDCEFIGWLDGFKGGQSKCIMSCQKGRWTPRAHAFIYKGQIAFNRGLTTMDDAIMIKSFFDSGAFDPETKFTRERKSDKWYWRVDCPVCSASGVSQPQHLQRGCRPCLCGNYKQKYSYIHLIYDGDLPIALKFGVTRSKDMRLKYQSRKTIYRLVSYGVWEYKTKEDCIKAERFCLENLECGVLSKSEFGDGYTETTHAFNLEKVEEVFNRFGGRLVT